MWRFNSARLNLQEATQRGTRWSVQTSPGGALICILIGSHPTFPEALTWSEIEVHVSENITFCSVLYSFLLSFFLQTAKPSSSPGLKCSASWYWSSPPYRIHSGTVWGPRDASVRPQKRLQLRHRRHTVVFLQYGLPPGGGAWVGLPRWRT